jgi:hypothetical protein
LLLAAAPSGGADGGGQAGSHVQGNQARRSDGHGPSRSPAQRARPLLPDQPRPDGDGRGLCHDRAAHRLLSAPRQPADAAGESLTVVAPLLWLAAFQAFSLYAPQHLSSPEEFRRTFGAANVGIVLLVVTSYWSHSSFSRGWMGATWVLALLLELLTRRDWRRYQVRLKGSGRLSFRTLIVGTSPEAGRRAHILDSPTSGFVPLSYVHGSDPDVSANSLPLLGELEQL